MAQKQYTARDESTGKTITFEWHGETAPTDADLADVFAAANDGGPPEPSVMDDRNVVDKGVDWLPSIGGTVGGLLTRAKGTPVGAAASGAGAAIGEFGRQGIRLAQGRGDEVPDTLSASINRAVKVGGLNAAGEIGGRKLVEGLAKIAPKFMRGALGAQTEVRKAFDDVDLDAVAVREGVIVPKDAKRIETLAKTGAASLRNNLRVADIQSGNAPVSTWADAVSTLRKRVPDARMAAKGGSPEELNAVKEGLRRVRGLKKRPLNREETFVTKQANQKGASSDYRAKLGAEGEYGAAVKGDIAQGLNTRLKSSTPEYADDIQRAKEMMALERALFNAAPRTSILRDTAGASAAAATGIGTGFATGNPLLAAAAAGGTMALNRAATSPGALSRYAKLADRVSSSSTALNTGRAIDPAVRQLLLELLMGQDNQR